MPTAVPLLETKIFPGDLTETIGITASSAPGIWPPTKALSCNLSEFQGSIICKSYCVPNVFICVISVESIRWLLALIKLPISALFLF
ncbi:uncharacterized protein H6S33_005397 [Morchella sextelata]|uniref:uncharacterized protein n=1 Tax=Morchella sextelata TaxID=1174677 RepID=UPI001D045E2B|nr:uncharacterized protein H6S33_005397 [Morchella sextelata]KAH0613511.1 hypothetical protein H6S33_005397 [Morchella sextelata]